MIYSWPHTEPGMRAVEFGNILWRRMDRAVHAVPEQKTRMRTAFIPNTISPSQLDELPKRYAMLKWRTTRLDVPLDILRPKTEPVQWNGTISNAKTSLKKPTCAGKQRRTVDFEKAEMINRCTDLLRKRRKSSCRDAPLAVLWPSCPSSHCACRWAPDGSSYRSPEPWSVH